MKRDIHYDTTKIAEYAANKSSIGTLLCLDEAAQYQPYHLDIYSEFTAEPYQKRTPVYVKQMPKLGGTRLNTETPLGRLNLNIYGSKPGTHTYYHGLALHILKKGSTHLDSDP